jgi:hypothetical protein
MRSTAEGNPAPNYYNGGVGWRSDSISVDEEGQL